MRNFFSLLVPAILLAGLMACNEPSSEENSLPKIVATTGMIADAVEHVVGDKATVESLMGPGVDPHLYKPVQSDRTALNEADVIFYNGLRLEGKFEEIFEMLSEQKPVHPVSNGIAEASLLKDPGYDDAFDPHIWFDVSLWILAVEEINTVMQDFDPENADYYQANTDAYKRTLNDLHVEVGTLIAEIPDKRRVLITTHDAFSYFGRAYALEVRGLQGISTATEVGLRDIEDMVDFITENGIPAVFVESSASTHTLEKVIEGCESNGHSVINAGTLYADAMGEPGTDEGTYIGMVRYNANAVHDGLMNPN